MTSDDSKVLTVAGEPGAVRTASTLAEAVIAAERTLSDSRPERVILADDSDLALAAALAAIKHGLPVAATSAAREAATTNGRLIAQLTLDAGA